MFSSLIKAATEFVFPKFCISCKTSGTLLCDKCWLKIPFVYVQNCPVCQHPSIGGLTHPRCKTPWGIDGLCSIAYYRGPIRALVRQLKYAGATVVSELIEQLILHYQKSETILLPPGIITTIPLDTTTQKKRGYNQSEIVAEVLSRNLAYPYIPNILWRKRKLISQTKLSKEDRKLNMLGAFGLAEDVSTENLKGATVIVVDDVFTTGATLREAAKVLKRAGVAKVYGFTLAQD